MTQWLPGDEADPPAKLLSRGGFDMFSIVVKHRGQNRVVDLRVHFGMVISSLIVAAICFGLGIAPYLTEQRGWFNLDSSIKAIIFAIGSVTALLLLVFGLGCYCYAAKRGPWLRIDEYRGRITLPRHDKQYTINDVREIRLVRGQTHSNSDSPDLHEIQLIDTAGEVTLIFKSRYPLKRKINQLAKHTQIPVRLYRVEHRKAKRKTSD